MEFITDMPLVEWIIMFVVFAVIEAAHWLIDDSRRRGMFVGGRACSGRPHYCQVNRNCDGTPKSSPDIGKGMEET